MTPREHTARLLQQWLQMTGAESQAIQTADWPKLRDIQSRKASLRQPLGEAWRQWKSGQPRRVPRPPPPKTPFRAQSRPAHRPGSPQRPTPGRPPAKSRAQQLHLERAAQNLRNIRRSYAPPTPPSPATPILDTSQAAGQLLFLTRRKPPRFQQYVSGQAST